MLALITEDLEGFVEDRSQLGEYRATANATTLVVFNLRLWNAQRPNRSHLLLPKVMESKVKRTRIGFSRSRVVRF